jgi:DNA-binding MarR family transcriptional regulator
MKTDRQLELVARGFSNHKRIAIMRLLLQEPGVSVATIARKVRSHYQTTSEHVRKLHRSGLIHKRQPGPAQRHELSVRGKAVLKFLGEVR